MSTVARTCPNRKGWARRKIGWMISELWCAVNQVKGMGDLKKKKEERTTFLFSKIRVAIKNQIY